MSPTLIVIGVLVLVAFGAIALGAYNLMNPTRTAADRLAQMNTQVPQATEESLFVSQFDQEDETVVGGMLDRIGQIARPATEEERDRMKQLLLQAGYKGRHALEVFNGLRVSLSAFLPILVAPFSSYLALWQLLLGVAGLAAFGYYLPWIMVNSSVEKRKAQLLAAFPDAMDLLVSSVEAGLGIDAAFRRVSQEIMSASPELGREFQMVNYEISAGVPRIEALKHLSERTGLDEVRSLVNMLGQAERFGTSIANSLRVQSKLSRQKRMSRAEEEAAKVSPKLTVVMILFMLPSLFIILIGPAAIQVLQMMSAS